MIDTHSHIYAEEFDADRSEVITRAKAAGIEHIILPNCDSGTLPRMLQTEAAYPDFCSAAIGLHPTSVGANYKDELALVKSELERRNWIAVGEIGIDLYWDKTFLKEQIHCFSQQIEWALAYRLPVIIHVRESFEETMQALEPFKNSGLRGVFHSFTGTAEQAAAILNFGGFKLGINGILTFKNAGLVQVVQQIALKHLVLETDAPYLSPAPYRGKRNESAYLALILKKMAEAQNVSEEIVKNQTTLNAKALFWGAKTSDKQEKSIKN